MLELMIMFCCVLQADKITIALASKMDKLDNCLARECSRKEPGDLL